MDVTKIEHAVKMRQARDKVIRDLLDLQSDDPEVLDKSNKATAAWLEVEAELSAEEFTEYMKRWRMSEA